jgi:diguanylate cyclase (GGDEF)-like protein/PAS domain S-box-containing protein
MSLISPSGRFRRHRGTLTWLGLAGLVLFLAGFALWIGTTSQVAGDSVRQAIVMNDAYERARFAVASEESLERKYRLEPGPDVLARYRAASAALVAALGDAQVAGTPDDRRFVERTLDLHRSYLVAIERMFAAVDRHEPETVLLIDANEVDPIFGVIDDTVSVAADRHHQAAIDEVGHLHATDQFILSAIIAATPIVLVLGFVLLLLFRRINRGLERRVADAADRELEQARMGEERFRLRIQNAGDTVVILDRAGRFTYCSPAIERTWGFTPGDLLGRSLFDPTHISDVETARSFFETCLARPAENVTVEFQARTAAGEWRTVEVVGNNLFGHAAVDGIVLTFRDVADRRAMEDELRTLAFRDPLTGLANRAVFTDRLERSFAAAVRRGRFVGALFLDLDKFKLVNDGLGHRVGDLLLVAVAERLRAVIRSEDMAARLGGDEFTILVEDMASEAEADDVARRILDVLASPFVIDGQELHVSASIGVAVGGAGRSGPEALLRHADMAMYRAKAAGGSRQATFDRATDAGAAA